jgi:outer membrane autotransporter protein
VHEKVNGSGNTLAVSANYRWAVTNTFFVQPFGGLNWTVSDLDDFRFNAGTGGPVIGTISAGSDESLVGRMGVQLSYVQALTTTTFVVPFAAASAWRNFKNETDLKAIFDPGFGNATVDANTVGARDYMQYDVGVSLSNPSAGVVGFVKGTFREGDINGQAVSVGGRVNF